MSRSRLISFICCIFFLPALLQAQDYRVWEPLDGVPIRVGDHISFEPQKSATVSDENGNVMVAWLEYQPGSSNIVLQKIAPDGSPVWDESVHLECEGYQSDVQTVYAGNETWWVVWCQEDTLDNFIDVQNIVVQKVDNNGNTLFASGGISIMEEYEWIRMMKVLPYSDGTLSLMWSHTGSPLGHVFYAQKLDTDGTPLWDEGGLFLCSCTQIYLYTMNVCATSDGGIAYLAAMNNPDQLLYQSIDASGDFRWGENPGPNIFLSIQTPDRSSSVDMVDDGEGGVFLCWAELDEEVMTKWLCVQRINDDGATCYHPDSLRITDTFDIFGTDSNSQGIYIQRELAKGLDGELLIAWIIQTESDQLKICTQKISGAGTSPTLHWDDNGNFGYGMVLDECFREQYSHPGITVFPDTEYGIVAYWRFYQTIDGENVYQIHMDHITNDGQRLWASQGQPASFPDSLSQHNTSRSACLAGNQSLHFFNTSDFDHINNELLVFTVDLDDGEITGPGNVLLDCMGGSAGIPDVAWDSFDQSIWYLWSDSRDSPSTCYIQKVHVENGEPLFLENGIPVFRSSDGQLPLASFPYGLIPDENGNCYVIGGGNRPLLQKISSNGELLWGDEGVIPDEDQPIIIAKRLFSQSANSGGFYLAYTVEEDDYIYQPKLQRITPQGTSAWNNYPQGITLGESGQTVGLYALLQLQNGNLVAVLQSDSYELYALYISPEGEIIDSIPVLSDNVGRMLNVKATSKQNTVFVSWRPSYYYSYPVMMQGITADLEYLWPEYEATGKPFLDDGCQTYKICPTGDNESLFWLSWVRPEDYTVDPDTILAQRVTPQGEMEFDSPLLLAGNVSSLNRSYQLCVGPGGDFWCVWYSEDNLNSNDTNIRYRHFSAMGLPFDHYYDDINGLPLVEMAGMQYLSAVAIDHENGLVTCWSDYRANTSDLYAQRIYDGYSGTTSQTTKPLPFEWELSNVYPNPFNPVTQVRFTVANAGKVSIRVYDLLGREVVQLANRHFATGQHSLQWDGSGLASGVYFIRLEAEGFTAARKAVLLK